MIIQNDLGTVDTETGIVISNDWENTEEFYEDREFTFDNSIILTYIPYGKLITIHRETNNQENKRDVKCQCGRTIQKSFHHNHTKTAIHYRLIWNIKRERVTYKKREKKEWIIDEKLCEEVYYKAKKIVEDMRKKKIEFNKAKYYEDNREMMIKKSLNYYYKVDKVERLKKITCECGRIVSKGNMNTHLKSGIHKRRLIQVKQ